MYPNPNLFFLLKDGESIAWDYKNHRQFSLEKEYFDRLTAWSKTDSLDPIPLDEELEEAGLLMREPAPQTEWGWDVLSQIFHVGTSDVRQELGHLESEEWTKQYLAYCKGIAENPPHFETEKVGKRVDLPKPDLSSFDNKFYLEALRKRKTCRNFNGGSTTVETLSTLLYTSLGPIHEGWSDLEDNDLQLLGRRKTFPSGGGLHPEEAYIVALNVVGLNPGLYHYNSDHHYLTLIKEGNFEDHLVTLMAGQYFLKGLAFGMFLTARFDKSWWKYPHSRSYRVVLMDSGHASQTILLTSTTLGLNTWLSGAFSDSKVKEFLEIKEDGEAPLMFIAGGHGDSNSLNPLMIEMVGRG